MPEFGSVPGLSRKRKAPSNAGNAGGGGGGAPWDAVDRVLGPSRPSRPAASPRPAAPPPKPTSGKKPKGYFSRQRSMLEKSRRYE